MMRTRIHPIVRIVGLVLLAGAWAGFGVLLVFGLARVRQFPDFHNFLVFIPDARLPTRVMMVATPLPPTPTSPARAFVPTATLIPPTRTVFVPTATPVAARTQARNIQNGNNIAPALIIRPTSGGIQPGAAPSVRSQPPSHPTRCQHSIETRLHVGATGYTSFEPLVRLRPSPGADAGTRLAGGTRFVITGEPRCADLWHPWNNYLWWPVRLTSGSLSGQVGWLPESMISEGRTTILLFPG